MIFNPDAIAKSAPKLAKVHYGDGDYAMLAFGDHVLCAVTGQKIPVNELKYWSVERQEAYVDGAASLQAYRQSRK